MTRQDMVRKRQIAEKIPIFIKMLNQKLPPKAIPSIAVRFAKDFFKASMVGYFEPLNRPDEFSLVEGAGFLQNMAEKVRLSAGEGILSMAIQGRIVVSKEDPFALVGGNPGFIATGIDDMEIDFVAPVMVNEEIVGAIVIAGSKIDIAQEKKYVTMLADLISNALQIAKAGELIEFAASTDELTRLFNRRYFTYWTEAEIRRAKDYQLPLTIFLFDIDHFKVVNDNHGHHAGDQVLRKIAEIIQEQTRSSDLVARYGGEEFVVVMPSSDKEQAHIYANNLREKIAATKIAIPGHDLPISVTISGGVASFPKDGQSTTDIVNMADQALYKAKQTGRNKINLAQRLGIDGEPIE
ncbi:MAG: diguanylate cyclase [Deltaproteobacteria bacterium]|nr:diguanylate cyclase [Deltaproteobacteria bacterium]